ncbi:MAG: APC family permease [Chthoniobacterales bacterium]
MTSGNQPARESGLIRAIGVPGLTANIVNTTIGAGIFALPASISLRLGAAAPIAFLACAAAMALFVTCFAIAGSRVSLTGGLYAYVEVAFGRYVGFLAGLLLFTTAVLSVAGIVNMLAGTIIALLPALGGPLGHIVIVLLVFGVLAAINIRGVRFGTGAVATMTIAKLVPLLIFVLAGIFFIKPAALGWSSWPRGDAVGDAVLLLLFAFFGIEVGLVPSGEVKRPAQTVPRAIYLGLAVTTALYILIQVVAQGTLGPALAQSGVSPLAESAALFLGNFGRLLLLAGATISAFGFVTSDVLSSPRVLFALGRDGILPKFFAHVHPRFHSPNVAIVAYVTITFAASLTSTFEELAIIANVAALLLYALCCAAAWELMRRDVRADGPPFSVPGAKVIPILALGVIVWILAHAKAEEFVKTGAVMAGGSILFVLRMMYERRRR